MKFVTKVINVFSGCLQLAIPPALYAQVAQLQQAVNSGKELEVEITIKRKRRSLNANAYLWQLLGQMAAVLRTDAGRGRNQRPKGHTASMLLWQPFLQQQRVQRAAKRRAG